MTNNTDPTRYAIDVTLIRNEQLYRLIEANKEYQSILQDLIDQLRTQAPRKYTLPNGTKAMGWQYVQRCADQADARLREVTP